MSGIGTTSASRKETPAIFGILVYEFLPYIEQIIPSPVAPHRFNRGFVGGNRTLMAGLSYPGHLRKIHPSPPYVDETVLDKAAKFKHWERISIYHIIGKQETEVKLTNGKTADFLVPNRQLANIIRAQKTAYFYDEFEGCHTWKYWQQDLKRALPFMFPL